MARKAQLLPDDLDLDAARAKPGGGRPQQAFHEKVPAAEKQAVGLKDKAVATTLYLLPADHKRLKTMAVNNDTSLQTLLLDAIDLLLTREGQPSCERWETRRKQR